MVERSKSLMNAVVVREFGGPDVLKVEKIGVPTVCSSRVLVKVMAVGVNPVEASKFDHVSFGLRQRALVLFL